MMIGIVVSLAADLENRFAVPVVGKIQSGCVTLYCSFYKISNKLLLSVKVIFIGHIFDQVLHTSSEY